VLAIAGQILTIVYEKVACSDEVMMAALKLASVCIEEARGAQFSAQLRAGMLSQYRPRR